MREAKENGREKFSNGKNKKHVHLWNCITQKRAFDDFYAMF
jgi:hypothetical protein